MIKSVVGYEGELFFNKKMPDGTKRTLSPLIFKIK